MKPELGLRTHDWRMKMGMRTRMNTRTRVMEDRAEQEKEKVGEGE